MTKGKQSRYIVSKSDSSMQLRTEEDYLAEGLDGIVEPYISFSTLRALYPANVYHTRALKLKAGILSQIDTTTLDKYMPKGITAKSFLYKFILNLEVYGTAFIERAGLTNDFSIYNLNSYYARVDIENNIHQQVNLETQKLEGYHLKYDSILSDYYGEPDYIAILRTISTLYKADVYNDKFFENGGKPSLVIIFEDSDPTDDQVKAIEDYLKTNTGGYENAHKNLILTTGEGNGETKPKIRIEKVGDIEDLSFEKLKTMGRDEIAVAHGVPPRMLGIVQSGGLGGSGELLAQMEMFLEVIINPKIDLIESFFKNIGIELKIKRFDLSSMSNDEIGDALVKSGVITKSEKKALLG